MTNNAYGDLLVVDLGVGMAPALVAKYLKESGARIVRVEPAPRDPFYEVYPAYSVWRRGLEIESETACGDERLERLLGLADVCLLGGEDFPGLKRRTDAAALSARHPRLVVLDIAGYPSKTRSANRPATDVLIQARSGVSYEHFSTRPLLMSFEPSSYGAALHGLTGLFGALYEREASGRGQVVSTSLYQGAIGWVASFWCQMEKPTPAANFVMPRDPWPLIFKCADGRYVHVVMGSAGSKGRLYRILEVNDPTVDINDSGMPQPGGDPKNFFGDIDVLAAHIGKRESGELLAKIWEQGLPAELILAPGECWDNPQVAFNKVIATDEDGVRHVGRPFGATLSPAPRRAPAVQGKGPLSGVRVVDFGAYIAGPYASTLLADLGADVVKVEVLTGDPNRAIFRSFTTASRGKRSIALDMKAPEALDIAKKLCARADIITNNFRPGVSARLGVDAASLQRMKPELIVLEAGAYGADGPLKDRAGFDMVFQAFCGHEYRAGGVGNPPLWNRTSMVDYCGGLLGAISVLEYLFGRARTGAGAAVSGALMNAGIYLLSELVQTADGKFIGAAPLNHERTGYHPAEQFYEAADGWIAIVARDDTTAKALAKTLDLGALMNTPRARWGDAEAEAIARAVRPHKRDELARALESAGVWAEACRDKVERETLNDPGLEAAGSIHTSVHPQFGQVREIGPLVQFSRSESKCPRSTPTVGEHTREILGELGFGAADIDGLVARKVVR